jgi:hypothetical protein
VLTSFSAKPDCLCSAQKWKDAGRSRRTASRRLCNVSVYQAADLAERLIYAVGQNLHAGCASKSNQGQNQKVFHQALASFVVVQANQAIKHEHFHLRLLEVTGVQSATTPVFLLWDGTAEVFLGMLITLRPLFPESSKNLGTMTRAWRCAWLIWLAGIEGAGYD